MRNDWYTNSEADAGAFDRMHNAYEDYSDYEPEPDEPEPFEHVPMLRCPRGCGAGFWFESDAYTRHMALPECANPWA